MGLFDKLLARFQDNWCGAIQYRCPECGKRVTVMDPFLPVRGEEKHEGNVVFQNGELDEFLWF